MFAQTVVENEVPVSMETVEQNAEPEVQAEQTEVPAEGPATETESPVAATPETATEEPAEPTAEYLRSEIARLMETFNKLKGGSPQVLDNGAEKPESIFSGTAAGVPKNHRAPTRVSNQMYVLLTKVLNPEGKIPQQQADIASIIVRNFEVGKPFSEEALYKVLDAERDNYPSLKKSVQHVSYLFRYYRGLSNKDNVHAGYIARKFIR